MGAMQLMQHVPVDIDEIAAVGAARHEMRVPDLVEQGLRHTVLRLRCTTEAARRERICGA